MTDEVAERFISVFERHLLPEGWRDHPEQAVTSGLAITLRQLSDTARKVTVAALDASIARAGSRRLGQVAPSEERGS